MKKYLSFGGGVNSVALMLLLEDEGVDFEAVFANHHCDYPDTYEYIDMLIAKGHKITILDTGDLYEQCVKYRKIPSRWMRWCTQDHKVKPLHKYFDKPSTIYLGIAAEESHRAKDSRNPDIINEFPLIDYGIDRDGCIEIITKHGLPIPKKSGCYFCPFQRKAQWKDLYYNYPDLYCKAKHIENLACERTGKGIYLSNANKPLEIVVGDNQPDMFIDQPAHCLCEL